MTRTATVRAVDGALRHVPAAPKWLPSHGKTEWRRVLPVLVNAQKISEHELQTVEAYCIATARIREAEAIIQAEGLTFMSPAGPKRHPATVLLKDSMEGARRLADALGLTPASRTKNKGGAIGTDDNDDLGDL
jgi:P27 family predicted phage terminase small subunit